MVNEWVAYSSTRTGIKLSVDTLEQFEHEVTCRVMTVYVCFPKYFCLVFSHAGLVLLQNLQVLNKKKSKTSFRKEDTLNKTRDIHSLQELYPLLQVNERTLWHHLRLVLSFLDRP